MMKENITHSGERQPPTVINETDVIKKIADWLESQKPLDPEDAKLLEENFWNLV